MKVQVKVSKVIPVLSPKNKNEKADRLCIKFSSPSIQVCRGASIPYFKINTRRPLLKVTTRTIYQFTIYLYLTLDYTPVGNK